MQSKNSGIIPILILGTMFLTPLSGLADDWPQWLGPKRDGIWREKNILTTFPKKGLKYNWRVKIGAGYSGPAVADGRVFITDRRLQQGVENPRNPFGRRAVPGTEGIICIDEKTGKVLWKKEYNCPYEVSYPAGPRTTPVVDGDKVYTLGTMGDLYCLRVADGSVVWHRNVSKDYQAEIPMWGFAGHPLIDGDRLICLVGGRGSLVVAFDKNTGKEIWKSLSSEATGYAPPMIFKIGGKRQLIMWHPQGIASLVPETGKEIWSVRHPKKGSLRAALSIPTPRFSDPLLFVTAFYDGPLMLKVSPDGSDADVLWQGQSNSEQPGRTEGLHAIMAPPFHNDGHIYGVGSYGELRCLVAKTGKRLWATRKPTTGGYPVRWANAFLIQHEDKFFLFNESGDLIVANLSPKGYEELSRVNILPATNKMAGRRRLVLWSHPAFANRNIYARNDNEIVSVSLDADDYDQQ